MKIIGKLKTLNKSSQHDIKFETINGLIAYFKIVESYEEVNRYRDYIQRDWIHQNRKVLFKILNKELYEFEDVRILYDFFYFTYEDVEYMILSTYH